MMEVSWLDFLEDGLTRNYMSIYYSGKEGKNIHIVNEDKEDESIFYKTLMDV